MRQNRQKLTPKYRFLSGSIVFCSTLYTSLVQVTFSLPTKLRDWPPSASCGIMTLRLCSSSTSFGLVRSPNHENVRLILTRIVCAIIARDHRSLNDILRYFMKERQFVTDSYRLFAAVNRICAKDNLSYNNAPTQKFLLRQIKAVDHSLLAPGSRTSKIFEEKATLTGRDYNGDPVAATEMDVVLLVLYGHILYAGQSYAYSLSMSGLPLEPGPLIFA